MLTFDSIPQARVVRKGGQHFAPPPAPRTHEQNILREQLREALCMFIGMWPLTAVVLVAAGLLIVFGNSAAL